MSIARIKPTKTKPLHKTLVPPLVPGAPAASLAKLSDKIEKRLLEWTKNDANARVELGGLLEQVRGQFDHGQWLAWLSEHLPFSARSAQQFIELHQWAQRHALRFPKLAPLGPSKLYLLMRHSDALLTGLLARAQHVVPSTGERKTILRMTMTEFTEVVRTLSGVREPHASEIILHSYRTRVHGIVRATEDLAEHKGDITADQVEEMHDALLAAALTLSETFGLEN